MLASFARWPERSGARDDLDKRKSNRPLHHAQIRQSTDPSV
jgi:hypothetical protein